jgi:DNA polymerase-3 subunit epsilon
MAIKKFFFDVETTGLSWKTAAIHQLSIIVDIDGEEVERIDWRVKPFEGAKISAEALAVGGVTLDTIEAYPDNVEVFKDLLALLAKYVDRFDKTDKFHLCGYNNRYFDDRFLRAWFERLEDNYFGAWFFADSLDVMVLASQRLIFQRKTMKDFKLATVAAKLGVPVNPDKLHDALYDVEITRQAYNKITGFDLM